MALRYSTSTERTPSDVFPRFLPTTAIAPANYRIFVVLNHCTLLGLLVHALLIPIFLWLGVVPMAWFNVASMALWCGALLSNRRGYHNLAIFTALFEVAAHSALAITYLGWDSGFQYYLLLASPLFFFTPLLGKPQKILTLCMVVLIFVALHLYSDHHHPLVVLKHSIMTLMFYLNIIIVFVVQAALSHYYHFIATGAEERLQDANRQLAHMAGTDFLTGLINRRRLLERMDTDAQGDAGVFSLIMSDIDDFKQINDQFGHDCGDRILRAVARVMRQHIRRHDLLSRWGGEEFLLVLPDTNCAEASIVAEKMRDSIAMAVFDECGQSLSMTMSFGVCCQRGREGLQEMIARADKAMYRAKAAGKNCVYAVPEDSGEAADGLRD